ncbi:MAG: PLP-dependent aminotransferase family protein [Myxococcota bacterium]
MRTWELSLDLSHRDADLPVYRRIARLIAADIARGRLRPGEQLPSTRVLASELGVNRNTVVAAFEVLRTEEWITGKTTSGTYVADRVPSPLPPVTPSARSAFDLPPLLSGQPPLARTAGLLLLLGGVPDLRFVPHRELARALGQSLRGARSRRLLDYADPQGNERLRVALCDLLARLRGIQAPPSAICVVRGSQQALYLAARALLSPGDVVAVEACGFPPTWQVLRLAGCEPVPIPVDAQGIDVDQLAAVCATRRVRAVVVTPHHHTPTTVTLSPARRTQLLALAAHHRMMVIEDDYDFDFHYDGPPVLPLAASDTAGVVVYVGTLSKTLAPGLRLGYLVGGPDVVSRISAYRTWVDQQGDQVLEHAVALLLEEGVVQRHVRRARRVYQARRDVLCNALREHLPELRFQVPAGGMAVWAQAPGVDTDRWVERALLGGVAMQAGRRFRFDGSASDHVRIGFAACNEAELLEAVGRLAATVAAGTIPSRWQ